MGFDRVAPQVVRHSDGYTVQIGGRFHIEYLEAGRMAKVPAELDGSIVALHVNSIKWMMPDERVPSSNERRLIAERVCAGMSAMGDLCELIDD